MRSLSSIGMTTTGERMTTTGERMTTTRERMTQNEDGMTRSGVGKRHNLLFWQIILLCFLYSMFSIEQESSGIFSQNFG